MNGLRPYLKAVNLLKQWGSKNRIIRCTSAGQQASHRVTSCCFCPWSGREKSPPTSLNGSGVLSRHHFFIYSVRLKRCSFRQMSQGAESPFSSLLVARRPVKRQRQGHTMCSDFTAQLCCISPPVDSFPRGHLFFAFFQAQKNTQTIGAPGLNLTSDPQSQETYDVAALALF